MWFEDILSDSNSDSGSDSVPENVENKGSRSDVRFKAVDQNKTMDGSQFSEQGMLSLQDLAAQVVAKNFTCDELEQLQTYLQKPLDERPMERIAFYAFPQNKEIIQAEAKLAKDLNSFQLQTTLPTVNSMRQVGFMLVCELDNVGVTITFEKQHITSSECECCSHVWCFHVLSAVLHRIDHAHDVPLNAPLTEILHRLSRDQLHKLIQYSIAEKPVSMMNLVFKTMDAVRDVNSDLNVCQGAPDCTFGPPSDGPTQLERSLDSLANNLTRDLLSMGNFNKYNYFVDSYKESTVKSAKLYSYFHHVFDHVNKGWIETAGRILISLALAAASVHEQMLGDQKNRWACFMHHLEQFFTHFIVQFSGAIREDMIVTCRELNRTLPEIATGRRNESAERPALNVEQNAFLEGCRPYVAFYEPICAALLPSPPPEFQCLLDGRVQPNDSCYDEPLPVMMLRLEGLSVWQKDNSEETDKQIARLGIAILRKLLNISLKKSVLNKKYAELQEEEEKEKENLALAIEYLAANLPEEVLTPVDLTTSGLRSELRSSGSSPKPSTSCQLDLSPSSPQPSTSSDYHENREQWMESRNSTTSSVGEKRATSGTDGESSGKKKRKKDDCWDISTLKSTIFCTQTTQWKYEPSQESVVFCLLHVCSVVDKASKWTGILNIPSQQVLMSSSFRALELDRHRSVTESSSISDKVYDLQESLVTDVINLVLCNRSDTQPQTDFFRILQGLYIQATVKHYSHFGVQIPLVLIGIVLNSANELESMMEDTLKLCTLTLGSIVDPFQGCNVTVRESYSLSLRPTVDNAVKNVLTGFLTCLNLEVKSDRENLCQVITGMLQCDEGCVLKVFYTNIAQRWVFDRLSELPELQICMLKLLLHVVLYEGNKHILTRSYYNCMDLFEEVFRLCTSIGQDCIDLVVPIWEKLSAFFGMSNMKQLFKKMKSMIPENSPLPATMKEILFSQFEGQMSNPKEACDWLELLEVGSSDYQKALETVRTNLHNCPSSVLLYLARTEHERLGISHAAKEVFSKDVTSLIQKGLMKLCQEKSEEEDLINYRFDTIHRSSDGELQWIFDSFRQKPADCVLKSLQFNELLDTFAECFKTRVNEIISLMTTLQTNESLALFDQCKLKLSGTLADAYKESFGKALSNCSHTCYQRIVREMDQSSLNLVKFHSDGQAAFKDLLQTVRSNHRGKRKLMKIMDKVFMDSK